VTELSAGNDGLVPLSGLGESESASRGIQPLWMTEKKVIEQAIAACDGNINRAAQHLEVAPSTIYRKLQSWKAQNLNS